MDLTLSLCGLIGLALPFVWGVGGGCGSSSGKLDSLISDWFSDGHMTESGSMRIGSRTFLDTIERESFFFLELLSR